MNFDALMFDLDGTLLDTLGDIADAANAALVKCGFAPHPVAAYKYFVGEGFEPLMQKALPETDRQPDTIARCVAAMQAIYPTCWLNKTGPYAGVPELLDTCRKQGLAMTILSNKPDGPARQIAGGTLATWPFVVVRGSMPGVAKKPDPDVALTIARQIQVEPSRFIYLGDSGIDMQTARAAGMFAVGALWGFRPATELIEGGAQLLASTPMDLARWIA